MPLFLVSPQVSLKETDLTLIIPQVSTAIGALAGDFQWGPVNQIESITSKHDLVQTFGKPINDNFEDFFTADSFLNYSSSLRVIRTEQDGALNAVAGAQHLPNTIKVKNNRDFETINLSDGSNPEIPTFSEGDGYFIAKYPGSMGNSLKIAYCLADKEAFEEWEENPSDVNHGINLKMYFSEAPGTSEYCKQFGVYNDELHLMIVDEDGSFTGVPGTILERYEWLSLCPDARRSDGTSSYFVNVLNNQSRYVYWINNDPMFEACNAGKTVSEMRGSYKYSIVTDTTTSPPTEINVPCYYHKDIALGMVLASPTVGTFGLHDVDSYDVADVEKLATNEYSFVNGAIGAVSEIAQKMAAYVPFTNTTEIDVTLLMAGKIPKGFADARTFCNYMVSLSEMRKDSISFVSPPTFGSHGTTFYRDASRAVEFANELTSSSYGVIDSCAIEVYDQYHGVYRWIPANGVIAGLCAHTDITAEPWYSPAGYNRGQLRNISKISYNPDQMDRDDLYSARINPIVQFPGEGTILYGDKTLLSRPSAFDRINVRRLFNVLEKSISTMAKYMLFEFNDEFTRARFVNIVSPFLRDVKARRGIYDFKVVCDETNNTPLIIDSNEFVADIYVSPARSINFIQLHFIATPTAANFEEIISGLHPGQ